MRKGEASEGLSTGRTSPMPVLRPIEPSDAARLGKFFERLAADPQSAYFRPHPLTMQFALDLCSAVGREDEYLVAVIGGDVVGYAMLRGWDEGYATPAFGVAVDVAHRGDGLGRALLEYALVRAREHGASDVMLKVHPDNIGARRLYESVGFTFGELAEDGVQLKGILSLRDRAK